MEANPTTTVQNSSTSYDPLGGSVNEKTYSTGQVGPRQERDIPEPQFIPPPPDINDVPVGEAPPKGAGSSSATSTAAKPKTSFNPDMAELSDSEKTKAAEQMAVLLLNFYSLGHEKANSFLQISEKMIRRLQMKGEIDLTAPVPYAPGRFISMQDFINEFNESCKDTLSVDDDFKGQVMPPLVRVLSKHGAGMTDEQFLIFMFGQHMVMGGIKFMDMKKQTREVLEFAKQHSVAMYSGPVHSMQAVKKEDAAAPPPPPPAHTENSQVQQEAKVVTLQQKAMDDYNSRLSGGVPVNDSNVVTQLPDFGNDQNLKTMEEIYQQDVDDKKRLDKLRKEMSGGNLKKKRSVRVSKKNAVPGPGKNNKGGVPQSTAKKGPGRPRKS